MRFLKGAILFALTVFVFASCEQEENESVKMITFEDVILGDEGYWNGSDLSGTASTYESWGQTVTDYTGGFRSGSLYLNNVYNATWDSWSGISCSNKTDMSTAGFSNQYSVYASSGANDSNNFALICTDGASCVFDEVVSVKSLMINNSTYTYFALKDGNDGAGFVTKFAAGDYFYITVTGYDELGVEVGSINIYLADFRDGKEYICDNWTEVSLESLGKVKQLSFSFVSTDANEWGIKTPAYCCIDNIKYEEE